MSRTVIDEGGQFAGRTERAGLEDLASLLGIESFHGDGYHAKLPFMDADVTAGSESEYQTAVSGDKNDTDLPSAIKSSKYYSNLMRRIQAGEISLSPSAGLSGRYDGFRKIKTREYRLASIELLRKDVALIKALGAEDLLARCEDRIRSCDSSGARLTAGIMGGGKKGPLSLSAEDFNERAERYYREDLRKKNLNEALDVLRDELASFRPAEDLSASFGKLFSGMDPAAYVESNRKRIVAEELDMGEIVSLLAATSILVYQGKREASSP